MHSKEKGSLLLPLDVPSIQSNPILKHSSELQKRQTFGICFLRHGPIVCKAGLELHLIGSPFQF